MTLYAIFDPLNPEPTYGSIDTLLAQWDNEPRHEAGPSYVYAFRDASGSVFYVGKGRGSRAHDADEHRHGRLGYYVAEFLNHTYNVEILRSGLSNDDAELLESLLISHFGRQLVNWAGNVGATTQTVTVAEARETAQALRVRAQAAASERRLNDAVSICREGLSYFSEWERADHEAELCQLRELDTVPLCVRAGRGCAP
jgi:hypothetical protein